MLKFSYNYRNYGNDYYLVSLPVRFKNSNNETPIWEGIIDTGCPFILINHNLSDYIKITIKDGDWKEDSRVASGQKFKTAKVEIDLIIGHAHKTETFKRVKIRVSEFEEYPPLPLIGRYPLFEWYNVNFDNAQKICYLNPK